MLALYRSAREVYSVCQDLRQLYEMAVEAYAAQRPSPCAHEVELISDFRACRPCAYDAEPLLEGDAEPWDTGWSLVQRPSTLQKPHSAR